MRDSRWREDWRVVEIREVRLEPGRENNRRSSIYINLVSTNEERRREGNRQSSPVPVVSCNALQQSHIAPLNPLSCFDLSISGFWERAVRTSMVESSSSGKMTPPIKSLESSSSPAAAAAEEGASATTTFLDLEDFLLEEEAVEVEEAALRLLLLLL